MRSERQARRLEHENMLGLIIELRRSSGGALQMICNINS